MTNVNAIVKSIAGGQSSAHAYIIEGKAGSGRDGFIRDLSMGLECLDAGVSARPCGKCAACRQVAAGSSLDIVRMQMSGKTGYKTEDANAFTERLDMGAYGRYLIGIIDDADSLSETVQNKLLKTLEEPREDVIILLGTTNPDHLLSTVRSRCSTIRLQDDDSSLHEKREEIRSLAEQMLDRESNFYSVRDAIDKNIKSADDAHALIEAAEDSLRERMMNGNDPLACAMMIEKCEMAAADIEQGMDRSRALKRLFLEIKKPARRSIFGG